MHDEPVLSWKVAGLLLGVLLIVATALVKPLGVSTQYVVTDAMVLHGAAPGVAESNEYLSKYGEKQDWGIGYGWMLVLGMFVGGSLSAFATRRFRSRNNPAMSSMWQTEFGSSSPRRMMHAFTGGVLLLFGSRLAGVVSQRRHHRTEHAAKELTEVGDVNLAVLVRPVLA